MVALPILGKVAYNFLAQNSTEIQDDYPFSAYLFLCSIFVAMTNQVSYFMLCKCWNEMQQICKSQTKILFTMTFS